VWFGIEPTGDRDDDLHEGRKIQNLERDPRVSLLVEAGGVRAAQSAITRRASDTERVIDI
jgi:hypothetical protein